MRAGRILVDTRDSDVRARDGRIPGSVHKCHEGFSSSLAAARLQELGFENTTDVVGGFVAWAADGLPIEH